MKRSWIINVVIAVIAAVVAVLQEIWLDTPLYFLNAFGLSASVGICFSAGAEILKILLKFINYWEWHWKDVLIGCAFGILAALITSLAIC